MVELSNVGLAAAFAAGTVSFLSPCVLPLVPGYVSYVAGHSIPGKSGPTIAPARMQTVGLSLCFVFGFSTVFVLFGASATAIGQLLRSYQFELNIVGGVVVILFGLGMLGLLPVSWFAREFRFNMSVPGGQPIRAYMLGTAFAFGWTPCIGPILGAILMASAASDTVSHGIALLSIYSLGLGVPFVLAAFFTSGLLGRIKSMSRIGRVLRLVAGGTIVLVGVAMTTGYLSDFSIWLLQTFPVLGTIG